MSIIASIKYLKVTLIHKWYVFIAGLKIGTPVIRLIFHDWTKFLPNQFPYYGQQFFGNKKNIRDFDLAWLHHQNTHKHHWEYWIPRTTHDRSTSKEMEPIEMDFDSVSEMVADWIGASKAYTGKWPEENNWPWFEKNFDRIKVHPVTKDLILLKLHLYFNLQG